MTRFIDTNILVRLITNDVPSLAQEAISLVKAAKRDELIILDAVFVELFFVLEVNPQYSYTREATALAFEGLGALPQFKISEQVQAAFTIFKNHKKLDFMDCLLIAAADFKRKAIVTFDKDLLKVAEAA